MEILQTNSINNQIKINQKNNQKFESYEDLCLYQLKQEKLHKYNEIMLNQGYTDIEFNLFILRYYQKNKYQFNEDFESFLEQIDQQRLYEVSEQKQDETIEYMQKLDFLKQNNFFNWRQNLIILDTKCSNADEQQALEILKENQFYTLQIYNLGYQTQNQKLLYQNKFTDIKQNFTYLKKHEGNYSKCLSELELLNSNDIQSNFINQKQEQTCQIEKYKNNINSDESLNFKSNNKEISQKKKQLQSVQSYIQADNQSTQPTSQIQNSLQFQNNSQFRFSQDILNNAEKKSFQDTQFNEVLFTNNRNSKQDYLIFRHTIKFDKEEDQNQETRSRQNDNDNFFDIQKLKLQFQEQEQKEKTQEQQQEQDEVQSNNSNNFKIPSFNFLDQLNIGARDRNNEGEGLKKEDLLNLRNTNNFENSNSNNNNQMNSSSDSEFCYNFDFLNPQKNTNLAANTSQQKKPQQVEKSDVNKILEKTPVKQLLQQYNYVEKNQFLVNHGFRKEKKNFKILYNLNGDENKALALLQLNHKKKKDEKIQNQQKQDFNPFKVSQDKDLLNFEDENQNQDFLFLGGEQRERQSTATNSQLQSSLQTSFNQSIIDNSENIHIQKLIQNNYIHQHNMLCEEGFGDPKKNFDILDKFQGDGQQALDFLEERKAKFKKREQLKKVSQKKVLNSYPEYINIRAMYFDCSNMTFVNKQIRDYKVVQNNSEKMNKALIKVIKHFCEEKKMEKAGLIFDNINKKLQKNQRSGSLHLLIESASPKFKTADDYLVDLASNINSGQEEIMFVTSDIELQNRLLNKGIQNVLYNKQWFEYCETFLGKEVFQQCIQI